MVEYYAKIKMTSGGKPEVEKIIMKNEPEVVEPQVQMLTLENDILKINLPQGRTQKELLIQLADEFKAMEESFHGKNIKIYGRVTTGMSLWLGHKLAHVCKSVSIYDPKEGDYILVISH